MKVGKAEGVDVHVGGRKLAYLDSSQGGASWYGFEGSSLPVSGNFQLDSIHWRGAGNRFEGYTVAYRRKFVLPNETVWIFPSTFGKRVTYQVQEGQGAFCLRVVGGVAVKKMALDAEGAFTDSLEEGSDARYFLYRRATPLQANAMELDILPAKGGAIRDLETGDGKAPAYIIITGRSLLEQALALRDYRNQAKRAFRVETEVVLVEDIYRQFSGGRLSPPAIRDFLRWAYGSWGGAGQGESSLEYVLLFGDGHYDYRGIRASKKTAPPPMIIPPYEFFRGQEGIASDDFFGLLDPGEMVGLKSMLDLAIGRVPSRSPEEASAYLEKIRAYDDPAKAGAWRSRIVFAADDDVQKGGTGDADGIVQGHTTDSDAIRKLISANQPGTSFESVYMLDYPLNSAYHKPEAAKDLLTLINRGALVVNYVGHGSSNQWADEVLLQTNDGLARLDNAGRTPMLNAFSCTVGRFESLESQGMSEALVNERGKGAIAAVSATRESFPVENILLAKGFYRRTFPPHGDPAATVGDALRETKNTFESGNVINDSKYVLLGEPVLLLRKPALDISFTKAMDTIKALDCDTIRGRVEGGSGKGFVNLKIVSGAVKKEWVSKLGVQTQFAEKRGAILFERTFAYKDNAFSTEYFIPKQISFGDSTAQILAFAWDAEQEREGTASRQNLRIHGTGSCASDADGKGPRIRITGCEKKETGDVDFPDQVKLSLPYCLQINVEDSLGGVLSAEGPDEGTTVEILGAMDPFHPQPGIDELNQKTYQVPLEKTSIRPGSHLLKVSARDGYGNISIRHLKMDLTLDSSLNVIAAYNAPNPMKRGGTTFHFSSVLPSPEVNYDDPEGKNDRLEFEIRIFNQQGHLVRVFEQARSGETSWDGRDRWGGLLGNGVYFYKVTARQNLAGMGQSRPEYRTVSSKRNILVISR